MPIGTLLAATFVAVGTSLALTAFLVRQLPRMGFLDTPNHRSSHTRVTPRGGGIAVLVGTTAGFATFVALGGLPPSSLLPLVPCVLLGLVGLGDDYRDLPATVRLVAQAAVALILAAVLAAGELPFVLLVAAAVYVVVIVNATNFMDGINGITSLNGIVICLYFGLIASAENSGPLMVGSVVLAAAILGFMEFNARGLIFIGDVGTYFMGTAFAGLSLWTLYLSHNPLLSLAPLLIYLADTLTALAKKALHGKPLLASHKDHVYQRLSRSGLTHLDVTLLTAAFTAFTSAAVLTFWAIHLAPVGYALALAAVGIYLALPAVRARRRLRTKAAA